MKLVAILGSPRGMQGNTGTLLDGVLQGARDAGAAVTIFSLAELDVQPCRGCEGCHITGVCPISDDFAPIKAAMEEADGLVLASPNYILSVTAQLKALLDRCSGPIHTQALAGKYAAAVVTSGNASADVADYMLHALRLMGFTTVGSVAALGWQMANPATRAPQLTAAAVLGAQLVEAIRTQQHFPAQDDERHAIMERFRQLVTLQKDYWRYEYAIWQARV
jgi:multimeric flavodoxin WrbA